MVALIVASLIGLLALMQAPRVIFRIHDLRYLDATPCPVRSQTPSAGLARVLDIIQTLHQQARRHRGRAKLHALREFMDHMNDGLTLDAEIRPSSDPAGEWVLAPGASPARRTLYIHGGGWLVGSPRSHRAITERLSQQNQAAVFAVDYRLMPEHRFMDGLEDCRSAWQWLVHNGPDGPAEADVLVVAGDSAGGSHALSLIAWLRDQPLRQADAAVALAPATDLTFTAPSNLAHLDTDPLLGPLFRPLQYLPRGLRWWLTALVFRVSPTDPAASPLRGDLTGLPPTLIHATDQEMLVDNARRYTAKARNAGSAVTLHLWPGLVHVWHLFRRELPEADEAFEDIRQFLAGIETPPPERCDKPAPGKAP